MNPTTLRATALVSARLDMASELPSKALVFEACTGTVSLEHPVLHAVRKLTGLHAARPSAPIAERGEIDGARAGLVHEVDTWVSAHVPQPLGAAYLHTESVGMILDRFAQYYIDAHAALGPNASEPHRHFVWQRLAQLADAYTDLSAEISGGLRKLPIVTCTLAQYDSRSVQGAS